MNIFIFWLDASKLQNIYLNIWNINVHISTWLTPNPFPPIPHLSIENEVAE